MTGRVRAKGVLWAVVALWAVLCFPSVARAFPYLEADIVKSISGRADFLRVVGLTEADFFALELRPESFGGGDLADRLASSGGGGPWYHYIRGVLSAGGGDAADGYYGRAVDAAARDPGALWLLAVSFIRNDHFDWAIESFTALERELRALGGASAPFLSMQLMLLGNEEARRSQSKRAEFCYGWARRFDRDQSWWAYGRGAVNFPNNVARAIPTFLTESADVLLGAWRAQIALAAGAHRFLSTAAFIFICAVMFILAVKHLPSGVHTVGDLLFGGASPRFKVASGVIVALSSFLLGMLPGLWITAFLVCRFVTGAEKKLLILACALLALSPLNSYVAMSIKRHAEPASPAVLLNRAVSEGYSNGLHELITANVRTDPDNYANQLSLAVSSVKNRAYGVSSDAVNKALQLAPEDPVALLYAGNIAFLSGNEDGMTRYYGELLKIRPQSAEAKYNLSLAYADKGGFTSTDMISEAANIDPALIGNFMQENERYFSGDTPPLRKVMQPRITPGYFWARLFAADIMEIFEPGKARFRGVSPIAAFGVCAAAFALLLILNATVWGDRKSKARAFFVCRICGRLLCRKCRKGTLCSACYKTSLDSHNNAAMMYNLQKKHQESAQLRKDVLRCVTGIVIPGGDRLYVGDDAVVKPALTMLLSSAIYAAVYCAATFGAYYPASTVIKPVYFVSVLLIYNVVALIRQLKKLSATLKMRAKMG